MCVFYGLESGTFGAWGGSQYEEPCTLCIEVLAKICETSEGSAPIPILVS